MPIVAAATILILVVLILASFFIAYSQKKDLWSIASLFTATVLCCALIRPLAKLSGVLGFLPDFVRTVLIFLIYGCISKWVDNFFDTFRTKALKKEYPALFNESGSFVHEGVLYEKTLGDFAVKEPALKAYFTIHYPDGSSKSYPARFFIVGGDLTKAGLKRIPPYPYQSPEENPSRENISEWKKYNSTLYRETNFQKSPE